MLLSTFMGTPPIVILDEPTNLTLFGADYFESWEYLWEVRDDHGTMIIFVTQPTGSRDRGGTGYHHLRGETWRWRMRLQG